MGRFVASYNTIASASGDTVAHRETIVFIAAFLAMLSLGAAVMVWLTARRHGWIARLRTEE